MNLKKVLIISLMSLLFTLHDSAACIITHPVNATICAGSSISFSVNAVGAISYQWQVDSGTGFINILFTGSGPQYDTNSWALPVLQLNNVNATNDGYQYRCIVCCSSCLTTDTSWVAILTVVATTPAQPSAIAGTINPCQNVIGLTYSVAYDSGLLYIWTLPADWTIVSGQNTDSVLVNAGIGAGDIIVTTSNACGNGPSSILTVFPLSVPAQPSSIIGSTAPCQGTSQIYTVPNESGVIYLWTFPATWSQTDGDSNASVTATVGAGSGNISVIPSNTCGNGLQQTLSISTQTIPSLPSGIIGESTPCWGSIQTYSVINDSGAIYLWTFPTGWSQIAGNNTDSITAVVGADSGIIQVTPSNACGNGLSQTLVVIPATIPTQPNSITGSIAPCEGSSQNYSVPNITGVNYLWTFPSGWSQTSGGNSNSVIATVGTGSGNIQVTPTNGCGKGLSQTMTASPITLPTQPNPINGNTAPCQGTSQNYSVSNVTGVSYAWTFPSGWSQTSGGNSNSVTAIVGAGSGNIQVTPSNACGNGLSQTMTASPITLPLQPNSITGSSTPCQGTSQNYVVSNVAGVSYIWTFPSGWSQTTSGNSNAVTATVGAGSGNIQVTPSNECGNGLSQTLVVSPVTLPLQPNSITGSITPCQSSSQNYSVPNVTGVNYLWTFPSGWSQTSGGNSNSVIATVGAGSGNIQVTPSNGCGNGLSQTLAVSPVTLPLQPNSITGSITPCQSSSQNYSVPNVTGVNYLWTFPSGWSQTAGGNTNSVTATVGAGSGNIQVTPSNACGNGLSQTLAVSPGALPSQPNTITGSISPCQGTSQNYSVSNVTGVNYTWTFPSGWSQTSGGNTNSVTATAGAGSGNIQVTPSNGCGNGLSQTLVVSPVTLPLQPNSIAGSITPCQSSSQNYSVYNVTGVNYTWTFPSGWSQTSGGNTNSVTATAGAGSGNIQVTPSNGCGNGLSQTLAVSPAILPSQPNSITGSIAPCEGSSQNYGVSNVTGVSYTWTFPSGWLQTSGDNTNSITATAGAGSGNIQVTPSNACGNGLSQTLVVLPVALTSQPGTISGNTSPCQGSSQNYSVPNVTGVNYLWSFPSGWSQTSGGNSNAVTATVGAGSGNIQVTPSNGCGIGTASIYNVTVNSFPHSFIIGDTQVCQNAYWVKYSVSPLSNDIIKWTIANGEFWQNGNWSSNPVTGLGMNEVYVHWIGIPNKLFVEQTTLSGCHNFDSIEVSLNGLSPDMVSVIAKNNDISENILICPIAYTYYYWGYEAKSNFFEINKCSGTNWCLFDFIDTANYYYWVKTGYDDACLVKSYFNQPLTLDIDELSSEFAVKVFPNPFNDYIEVELDNEINKKLFIKIYSVLNDNVYFDEFVPDYDIFKYKINTSQMKEGIYFMLIGSFDGKSVIRKIVRINN